MIYNEEYVSRAFTVGELVEILKYRLPSNATVEMATNYDHTPMVEVWYDKDTNTVILK